jgi:hypothetical protein
MLSGVIVAFCLGALLGGIVGVAGNSWWRRYQQRRMAQRLLSAIDQGQLGRHGSDRPPGPMEQESHQD